MCASALRTVRHEPHGAIRMSDTLDRVQLADIAMTEITRRLKQRDELIAKLDEVERAMERAALLIDYASARHLTPRQYEGPMLKLYRAHHEWIEAKRALGQFPALEGTKAPVARPKRQRKELR